MKKIYTSIGLLLLVCLAYSQGHADALRYSQHTIGGSARNIAMGGAFGALGGDFSSLSQNPAGIAVYRGSEFSFSPELYIAGTKSRYFGEETTEGSGSLNINNMGYVSAHKEEGLLKYVNFGFGFNKIANFNRNYNLAGVNEFSSLGDYMVQEAYYDYAFPDEVSSDFGYFSYDMFYEAGIFDYYYDAEAGIDTFEISSMYIVDGDFRYPEQDISVEESGKINEWAFSFGLNLTDVLYLGGTFGIQPVYYSQEKHFVERDANDLNYEYFDHYENLNVTGTGYTAKFGAIFRPIPMLRLGAAFHLPVSYFLHERYKTQITTSNGTIIPRVYDRFDSDYRVTTPAKAILSAGLVLGKFLIISGDLEYIDYTTMRMRDEYGDWDDVNRDIKGIYKETINLKTGAEWKIGSYYLRGGLAFLGSPYAETEENADAYRLCYSGGVGFRDKNYFIDLSYQFSASDERQYQYVVDMPALYDAPVGNIDNKLSRITTTIGFRF
ncbi:MAG: hypothetical protein JXA77_10470 [Bacteroidales bacterium]|nr:hypothetical protein [Bacteroidales bacterium]MBN2817872.1 hypothetical protein [Bacteroidales bacterium]